MVWVRSTLKLIQFHPPCHGRDTLHTPGYLSAPAIWRHVHSEYRQGKFAPSNILFIKQKPMLWFHIPAVPTEEISQSVKQIFCRSQLKELSVHSQVSEAIPISHLSPQPRDVPGQLHGHHSCRVTVPGWTLPRVWGALVHSSATVAVQKESKQTVGWAISLSHSQSLTTGLFLPQLLAGGHGSHVGTTEKFHEYAAKATEETRWGLCALQPKALLCIPPGCLHSRSIPCCPQPEVTWEPLLWGTWEAQLDKT